MTRAASRPDLDRQRHGGQHDSPASGSARDASPARADRPEPVNTDRLIDGRYTRAAPARTPCRRPPRRAPPEHFDQTSRPLPSPSPCGQPGQRRSRSAAPSASSRSITARPSPIAASRARRRTGRRRTPCCSGASASPASTSERNMAPPPGAGRPHHRGQAGPVDARPAQQHSFTDAGRRRGRGGQRAQRQHDERRRRQRGCGGDRPATRTCTDWPGPSVRSRNAPRARARPPPPGRRALVPRPAAAGREQPGAWQRGKPSAAAAAPGSSPGPRRDGELPIVRRHPGGRPMAVACFTPGTAARRAPRPGRW